MSATTRFEGWQAVTIELSRLIPIRSGHVLCISANQYQEEFFNNYRYLQLADDITVPISSTITAINAQLELASEVQVAPLALSKNHQRQPWWHGG